MIHTLTQTVRIAQPLSLLALVAVFVRPNAPWSLRARLPVAIIAFVSSAALLLIDTL